MSDEDCTIEKEKNIIELLLEKDLTRICFKIFSYLDSDSFCNARLVCHGWKDFIDYQFYELPNGIKWRSDKFTSNFLGKNFMPREQKISINEKICSAQVNKTNIFISTYQYKDNLATVSNYEFNSLKLVWSLKFEQGSDMLFLYLNNDRLYAHTMYSKGIYIIDSALGNIIHKIENINPLEDGNILQISEICVLDNKMLAVSYEFVMKIYNIEAVDTPYLICEDTCNVELDNLTVQSLQNDGDKLIYQKDHKNDFITHFIARNFNSGEKLGEIRLELDISEFKVRWPYLFCTGLNQEIGGDGFNTSFGVRIFDMEKKTLFKHIIWPFPVRTVGIELLGKFVLIHELIMDKCGSRFLSFEDFVDEKMPKIEIEKLTSRHIEVPEEQPTSIYFRGNFIVGDCLISVLPHNLVKKSYWISKNFNSMNDNDAKSNIVKTKN